MDSASSSSISNDTSLRKRNIASSEKHTSIIEHEEERKGKPYTLTNQDNKRDWYIAIALTVVACFVRLWKIDKPASVV
jgi:hypothetical protein